MTFQIIEQVGNTAMFLMVPLLFASLGELVGERAGVLNVGVEGVMLLGGLTAAIVSLATGQIGLALIAVVIVGALAGLILGFLYITRAVDQIIGGILFTLVCMGLTTIIFSRLQLGGLGGTLERVDLPFLVNIPVLGPIFFRQSVLTYAGLLVAAALYWVVFSTWFGIALTGCGSNPLAVDSAGLSVVGLRYVALLTANVLGAVGGAALVLTTTGSFLPGITSGQGFIALAIVVLGRWNPLYVLGGSILFGLAQALQFRIPTFGPMLADLPGQLWLMVPFVVAIAAVLFAKGARYPAAVGIPFTREIGSDS